MTYYANRPSRLSLTNDTVATAGNTGGVAGASLTPVTTGSGTITYQSSRWRFRRGATSSAARLQLALESSARYSVDATFELLDAVTIESRILMLMNSPTTYAALVTITTAGIIRVHNTSNQIVYQTPSAVTGKFRVHLGVEYADEPGVVDGKIRFNVFTGANVQGTTPNFTFSSNEMATGAVLLNSLWVGHANNGNAGHDFYLINLQADSTTVEVLPPLQEGEPTAQATATSQSYVLIDARSSQSGSGSLAYSISPSAGTTELVAGWWAVLRSVAAVEYTITVTDSVSSLQDTTTVTVDAEVVAAPPADYTGYTQTLVKSSGVWS